MTAIDPTEQQLEKLTSGNKEGPFHFVNLLRFKDVADYPSDHEMAGNKISGKEAYDIYGSVAFKHVTKRGGRLITLNAVQQQLVGDSTQWHRIATMEYQNADAFVEMISDPEYKAAVVHRNTGLESTEIFVTRSLINEPIS
jgi:uncharacterized protein (DUF1330 family)